MEQYSIPGESAHPVANAGESDDDDLPGWGGQIDDERLEAQLNEYGHKGWELITITSAQTIGNYTLDMVAIFKRPLTADGIDFVDPSGR